MSGTALFIKDLEPKDRSDQRLYLLDPPLAHYDPDRKAAEYVVVSACLVEGAPETYIFAADESGEITNWCEMSGSCKGTLQHSVALARAGYSIIGVEA